MEEKRRLSFGKWTVRDQKRRKGMPSLEDMSQHWGTNAAAAMYLCQKQVLVVPRCPTCQALCRLRSDRFELRCNRCSYSQSLVSTNYIQPVL